MKVLLPLTSLLVFSAGLVAAQAAPTATELANRIQTRYATVRDFTADFTQRLTSPLQTKPSEERGLLKVKKPDRMRWTYATNDKNVVVADGSRLYTHSPKDRVVYEQRLPSPNESSTALLFLGGRANLAKDFVPSLPPTQPATEWRLLLSPKPGPADFKTIAVDVDRTSYALRGFVVTDEEGAVTSFRFVNVRENQKLPESDFVFTMPKGVEVRRR